MGVGEIDSKSEYMITKGIGVEMRYESDRFKKANLCQQWGRSRIDSKGRIYDYERRRGSNEFKKANP